MLELLVEEADPLKQGLKHGQQQLRKEGTGG